jgi:formamidopyrimidine-DNA glycosylase
VPELPEVQSFADALQSRYAGKNLLGITFHRADLRFPLPQKELRIIFHAGSCLQKVTRVGKQLCLQTSAGAVHVSLGMSGAFFEAEPLRKRKHEHITLHFSDDSHLGFEDPRRFGFWKVANHSEVSVVDATDSKGLLSLFLSPSTEGSQRSIKDFLMDQRKISGVGNIYALEVLFLTGIHPSTACSLISERQWRSLAKELPVLMAKAIAMGGSSVSTYRTLHGQKGDFQSVHQVYARQGERCLKKGCKGQVERIVQGGRSSFFCAHCQPLAVSR